MITPVPYRPLGVIKELLDNHGFPVTHCYEDLVFVEHNAFLIQMGDKGEEATLIFNVDCDSKKREEIKGTLLPSGLHLGLQITAKGTYALQPNEQDSTISIQFNE